VAADGELAIVFRKKNCKMRLRIRARLDKESSTLADEYDTLAEENEALREKLARSQRSISPMVRQPERVEPGKLMSTPRVSPAVGVGAE